MNLKLFLLSPVTTMYNFQLRLPGIRLKDEVKRVIIIQLLLFPASMVLGFPIGAMLSISNVVYVILLLLLKGKLNRSLTRDVYNHTVQSLRDKSE